MNKRFGSIKIKLKTRLTEELILTYGKDFVHHDSIAPSEIIK